MATTAEGSREPSSPSESPAHSNPEPAESEAVSFFKRLPVDVLGDIGAYLCPTDRRSLASTARGMRHAALSLWKDDEVEGLCLKRHVALSMMADPAFCAQVRKTLINGPLPRLPIDLVVKDCCGLHPATFATGAAADVFPEVTFCSRCGSRRPSAPLPSGLSDLSFADGFSRVDLMGCKDLVRDVSPLRTVSTLVLLDCAVVDLSSLSQCKTLHALAVSACNELETLPCVPSLRRVEVRCCPKLKSVDALAHLRSVIVEGCEGVDDLSPLEKVHSVTIERRTVLTDVSALLRGGVHSLVLDTVAICPLPRGGSVHSLSLFAVMVSDTPPRFSHEDSARYAKPRPGLLSGALRKNLQLTGSNAGVDLSSLAVHSLSLCRIERMRGGDILSGVHVGDHTYHVLVGDHTWQVRGLDALIPRLKAIVAADRHLAGFASMAHLQSVTVVVGGNLSREGDLSPLVRVPRLHVAQCGTKTHGLLPALARLMRSAPDDVSVQRHGCGALVLGGRWSIGETQTDLYDADEYVDAVFCTLAAFPSDPAVVVNGLQSLVRGMPRVFLPQQRLNPAFARYVEVSQSFLARKDLPSAGVAAALCVLRKAVVAMTPMTLHSGPARSVEWLDLMNREIYEGDLKHATDPTVRVALAKVIDDATSTCVRILGSYSENGVVLPTIVKLFTMRTEYESMAAIGAGLTVLDGHRIPSADLSWVRPAIHACLACLRHIPLSATGDALEVPMEFLSRHAFDWETVGVFVRAGGLDALFARANAAMARSFNAYDRQHWLQALSRLVPYASARSDTEPALVAPDVLLDVARRFVRWATAGTADGRLRPLLYAGSEGPENAHDDVDSNVRDLRLALERHRADSELVAAVLFDTHESVLGHGLANDAVVLEIVAEHLMHASRPVSIPLNPAIPASPDCLYAVGRAMGGLARFASTYLRKILQPGSPPCSFAMKVVDALVTLTAAAADVGTAEDVSAALHDCTKALEWERLWEFTSTRMVVARAAASLLRWKFLFEGPAVAPSRDAMCALAALDALGAGSSEEITDVQAGAAAKVASTANHVIGWGGVPRELIVACRFLACAVRWGAEDQPEQRADFAPPLPPFPVNIALATGSDAVGRSLLLAVARGGFINTGISPSLQQCAVTFHALCALPSDDRRTVLLTAPQAGIHYFKGTLADRADGAVVDDAGAGLIAAVGAIFERMHATAVFSTSLGAVADGMRNAI